MLCKKEKKCLMRIPYKLKTVFFSFMEVWFLYPKKNVQTVTKQNIIEKKIMTVN